MQPANDIERNSSLSPATTVDAPVVQVLDPGHRYELGGGQELQFLKKEWRPLNGYRLVQGMVLDPPDARFLSETHGTTNEELLVILIDRTEYLDGLFPCEENKSALEHMRAALEAFNARTSKRIARGVEGKLEA